MFRYSKHLKISFKNTLFLSIQLMLFISMLLPMATKAAVVSDDACLTSFQQAWDKKQVWYVMDASCPVGEGLWNRIPDQDDGVFWVQCAMLSQFPEPWLGNLLKKTVSEQQIVLKPEGKQYRCLVGPFYRYSQAKTVVESLRKQTELKSAFIRRVSSTLLTSQSVVMNTEQSKLPTNALPAEHATESVVTTIDEAKYDAVPINTADKRYYFDVAGMVSPKPRLDELNYTSQDHTWWRATLEEANQACENNGMKLISMSSLKALAGSEQTRKQLPGRLPFWVDEQTAFDLTMMLPMKLTEKSALFVLCE